MTQPLGLVEKKAVERRVPAYRAITLGTERADWAVVDADGGVVFRGDAKVAAMIANRLTRPAV
jgi:hypothetical protein